MGLWWPIGQTVRGLQKVSLVDRRRETEFLLSGHWQLAQRPPTARHRYHSGQPLPPLSPKTQRYLIQCYIQQRVGRWRTDKCFSWQPTGDPLAVIAVISEPPLDRWTNCHAVATLQITASRTPSVTESMYIGSMVGQHHRL